MLKSDFMEPHVFFHEKIFHENLIIKRKFSTEFLGLMMNSVSDK